MTGPRGENPPPFDSLIDAVLSRRAELHQLRSRRAVRPIDAVHVEIDGRIHTNFCSNNYLGLTHHPRLVAALQNGARDYGAGAGAAGLISGFTTRHAAAELAVAEWKGTEAAVLLPSGYQANHAAIQTLAGAASASAGGVRFLLDKLAHASLLDAVRGTEAPWRVFPHNGLAKLERLLSEAPADQLQVVVTESIFSMDGDAVDLEGLRQIKEKHPFVLVLDEAHASGIYGRNGAGWASECGLQETVDVSIVTFSKAAGCVGGGICGSAKFCRAIVNLGRAYVYSTSIPPAVAAAIETGIAIMADEPHRRRRVRDLSARVRGRLKEGGIEIADGDSPIIPIVVGEESAALGMAEKLAEELLLAQAVRPPTVPRGTSRLRITLSCEHSDAEAERLVEAVLRLSIRPGAD